MRTDLGQDIEYQMQMRKELEQLKREKGTIEIEDLRKGDLMHFYTKRSFGSWFIRFATEKDKNHIEGLTRIDPERGWMLVGARKRVVEVPLSEYLNSKYVLYVGRVRGATQEEIDRVCEDAEALIGFKYDVSQLVWNLACLGILRVCKIKNERIARWLKPALSRLKNFADTHNEWTCSEIWAKLWKKWGKIFKRGADPANVSPGDIWESPIIERLGRLIY